MKIGAPHIHEANDQIVYRVDVEWTKGSSVLWYSLHKSFSDLLSEASDAPLVALLIPAMACGEDIHIDGAVSERLLDNLSRPLQTALRLINPSLRQIRIHSKGVLSGQARPAPGVATGFSAGIDSYCVLADYYYAPPTDGLKISHLLFNNVGSHAGGDERLFQERYERIVPITESLGLPLVITNSNLDSFYWNKTIGFQPTHTLRNASVALLMQGGIGRFMYASTYHYSDARVGPVYDIAYSDSVIVPLMSTDSIDMLSVGNEYTRVAKTERVATIPDSYHTLDVCVHCNNTSGYTNCSRCFKCLRTLATLDIAGCLDYYASSFDLDEYSRQRARYFAALSRRSDPFSREIFELAKARDYTFPLASRVVRASGVYAIGRAIRNVVSRRAGRAVSG